jgi:hypothetical protein
VQENIVRIKLRRHRFNQKYRENKFELAAKSRDFKTVLDPRSWHTNSHIFPVCKNVSNEGSSPQDHYYPIKLNIVSKHANYRALAIYLGAKLRLYHAAKHGPAGP